MFGFKECSRCGEWMQERFEKFSDCWDCHFADQNDDLKEWRDLELKRPKSANRNFKNNKELEEFMGLRRGSI